ncbi:MAG TPA: heavy metal-associated domain-containing protein [Chthonomonadaceae bacterium]|nr:heavy metal-associated domain-containing protein [Chthonomonadaceae bacterium]
MSVTLTAHCPAIECEGCANSIRRSLGKLTGIEHVDVEVAQKSVTVQYDAAQVDEAAVRQRLEQAGFPAEAAP